MRFHGVSLHRKLEKNMGLLIFGILFVSSIGGLVQVLPSVFQKSLYTATENSHLYTAIELAGRDVYIKEGCHVCHSQQIRPLLAEVERYGPYSRADEFVYDRPFLWGSKRTGPDLHRIGGKYSNAWHEAHLIDPRSVVNNSIMPAYPWLARWPASDVGEIQLNMRALKKLGHPYTDEAIAAAPDEIKGLTQLDVLIAYLQVLGTGLQKDAQ
jgi:cytochrome c oxidase cbb3-type subunit 2